MVARSRRLILAWLGFIAISWLIAHLPRPIPPLEEVFPYGEMRIGIDPSVPPFAVLTADDLFGLEIDLGYALGDQIGLADPVRAHEFRWFI